MKFLLFDDDITTDSINKLISQISDDTTIYFDSKGGSAITADYFIDFTFRTEHEITLITNWGVKSCAFDIFLKSKTKKIVLDSGFGIAHLVNRDINTTEIVKKEELYNFLIKDIIESNINCVSFYKKIGMNEEQIEEFESGEDVFISPEQLKEMAEKAEEIIK